MALSGDLSNSLNISSINEDIEDNLLDDNDELAEIQILSQKPCSPVSKELSRKRHSTYSQQRVPCKEAPSGTGRKQLLTSLNSLREQQKFCGQRPRKVSLKNPSQHNKPLYISNEPAEHLTKHCKISLEIPAENYKILLDKVDYLERENISLRECIKEKDMLIKKQCLRIHELTEELQFKKNTLNNNEVVNKFDHECSEIMPSIDEIFLEESSIKSLNFEELDQEVKEVKKSYYTHNKAHKKRDLKNTQSNGLIQNFTRTKPYNGSERQKVTLNTSVGLSIANCLNQQKLVMTYSKPPKKTKIVSLNGQDSSKPPAVLNISDKNSLRSPRIPKKLSDYKSTAEGSNLNDSRPKGASIMENYLNLESKKKDSFFSSSNARSMAEGKNSHQTQSSFGNTTLRLNKKINAVQQNCSVNALSLSLIGGLIKEHQGKILHKH
ncbi:unnamed protein product [Moneuplotes crassus]|uniref:Uncharacterized protein n=1 Tax=Euplotes crassus TaxID=5936 RepID=A0AAD1XAU2_EUPCR|nr:unnamed protein product [Moneuplotes crassus]